MGTFLMIIAMLLYIPIGVIAALIKPKKHRHGGRWCRRY